MAAAVATVLRLKRPTSAPSVVAADDKPRWWRSAPSAPAKKRPACCEAAGAASNVLCAKHKRVTERLAHLLSISFAESGKMLEKSSSLFECTQKYLESIDTAEVVAQSLLVEAERLDILEEVRDILNIDDAKARELLRDANWNLTKAIEASGLLGSPIAAEQQPRQQPQQQPQQPPQPAATSYYYQTQQPPQPMYPTISQPVYQQAYFASNPNPALMSFYYEPSTFPPSAPPRPIECSAAEVAAPVVGIPVMEEREVVQASLWEDDGGAAAPSTECLPATKPISAPAQPEWQGLAHFLESHGLGQYLSVFEEQELTDAESISLLSDEDVKALIPTLGGRKKAHHAINTLRATRQ